MIIKGRSRSNGTQLAGYLLHSEENEAVSVLEVSGMATSNLSHALMEMQEITDSGQKGVKGLYHSVISPQPGYELSHDQWIIAADELASALKLENQPRAIVVHEKQGRVHAHIVFQRTDADTLKLIPDGWNYIAHEKAARNLERLWDHEIIPGAHIDPKHEKSDKSKQADHDRHQATDAGKSRSERVAQITQLYKQSDGVKAFTSALEQSGYTLAQGDRRDYVLVDGGGRVFSLPRYIEGVKTKDVRKFMEPIGIGKLPSVADAKIKAKENREAMLAVDNAKNAKQDFQKAGHGEAKRDTKKQFEAASGDQAERRREKARKAVALKQDGTNWKEYGQSLKSRLSNSASLARNLTQEVKERFSKLAEKAKGVIQTWKQLISHGRTETDTRDTKPLVKKFGKAAGSKVERAKAKIKQSEKTGPSHDR